jgi:DNA-binding transcriptional LysR family regulator
MQSRRLQETSVRYFLEVVRCGSVTEAASRLNVSPSAVSRQVAILEDLLEVPLFDRRPRGMVPSAAGELLAVHAQRTAMDADRVVSDIQALGGVQRGRVRIASSSGFASGFLPRTIVAWRSRYPEVTFDLQVGNAAQVTAALLQGDADIGLTFSRTPVRDIRVEYRLPESVYAVMRPDHPLARFRTVTLAQMHPYPLALTEEGNTVRQLFDIACSERGLIFEPVFTANRFESLVNFVLYGGGLIISGEITVRDRVSRGELHAAEIREPGMRNRAVEVHTMLGRTLPAVVTGFLEFLRAELPIPSADRSSER